MNIFSNEIQLRNKFKYHIMGGIEMITNNEELISYHNDWLDNNDIHVSKITKLLESKTEDLTIIRDKFYDLFFKTRRFSRSSFFFW